VSKAFVVQQELSDILANHRDCFTGSAGKAKGCTIIDELAEWMTTPRPEPVEEPTWTNADGETILISSMTDAHLNNAINFLRRRMASDALAKHPEIIDDMLIKDDPRFIDLRREQVRRGLDIPF
jgi:hypothetical protein